MLIKSRKTDEKSKHKRNKYWNKNTHTHKWRQRDTTAQCEEANDVLALNYKDGYRIPLSSWLTSHFLLYLCVMCMLCYAETVRPIYIFANLFRFRRPVLRKSRTEIYLFFFSNWLICMRSSTENVCVLFSCFMLYLCIHMSGASFWMEQTQHHLKCKNN